MKESLFKANIVKGIRVEGGYARRIEDRFAVGMPDLVLIPVQCRVVWTEAKIIRGNILRPTPRQFVELMRLRIPPHSTSLMLGWKDDAVFCCPPSETGTSINDCLVLQPGETIGTLVRRTLGIEASITGESLYGNQEAV